MPRILVDTHGGTGKHPFRGRRRGGHEFLAQIHAMAGAGLNSDRSSTAARTWIRLTEALSIRSTPDGSALQVRPGPHRHRTNPEVAAARAQALSPLRTAGPARGAPRHHDHGHEQQVHGCGHGLRILQAAGRSPRSSPAPTAGLRENLRLCRGPRYLIEADERPAVNYDPRSQCSSTSGTTRKSRHEGSSSAGNARTSSSTPTTLIWRTWVRPTFGLIGIRPEKMGLPQPSSQTRRSSSSPPGRYQWRTRWPRSRPASTKGEPGRLRRALAAPKVGRGTKVGRPRGLVSTTTHNPAKVSAALSAAGLKARRVLAVYQPHGFAPTRLLRKELIEAFAESLRPQDMLWMPDIYYAGGTAAKDVSSADITGPLAERGVRAFHVPKRSDIIPRIAEAAQAGDLVLVMGARDPGLSDFAAAILKALS